MSNPQYPMQDRTTAYRTLQRLRVEKAHAETMAASGEKQALITELLAKWPELKQERC
jgi:hypothetical protein